LSPRTGRPPKDITKDIALGLRISKETAEKLKICAEKLNISRTKVIEKGIDLVEADIKK
jgi:cell division ATPase FtsA